MKLRRISINTDADISFMLQYGGYIRIITKSLSIEKFGWLVKNTELLRFIEESGGFQKTGSSWVGTVETDYIGKVIEIIYEQSACNALLTSSQMEMIQQDIVRTEVKEKQQYDLKEIR